MVPAEGKRSQKGEGRSRRKKPEARRSPVLVVWLLTLGFQRAELAMAGGKVAQFRELRLHDEGWSMTMTVGRGIKWQASPLSRCRCKFCLMAATVGSWRLVHPRVECLSGHQSRLVERLAHRGNVSGHRARRSDDQREQHVGSRPSMSEDLMRSLDDFTIKALPAEEMG